MAKLVGSWADNTDYTIKVAVRTGAGKQRNVLSIVGPVEEEDAEETEVEAEEPEMTDEASANPGAAAVKKAMMNGGAMATGS